MFLHIIVVIWDGNNYIHGSVSIIFGQDGGMKVVKNGKFPPTPQKSNIFEGSKALSLSLRTLALTKSEIRLRCTIVPISCSK